MNLPAMRRAASWRRIGLWLVVAGACWLAARALERHTRIEIFSTGSRLEVAADDSSIAVPMAVESVHRLEIVATASPFPPGGRTLKISQDQVSVVVDRLPARFDLPPGHAPPVGDWVIDDHAGTGLGYAHELELTGPFELAASFTGRPHQHLLVNFVGTPSFSVSFRRGLINNDLFIWGSDWQPLAVTNIAPQPAADALAALALLLDPAAAAAAMIALFLLILRFAPGSVIFQRPRQGGGLAQTVAAVALAAAAAASSLWMAGAVLERLPHLPDETVQLLQARWLSEGRLSQSATAIQDHLDIPFTYVTAGRWLAHYPPGWPLLLAAGLELGAPWVVAPLLGGLYVLLLWRLGRELFDGPTGVIAAALAVLSPMSRIAFSSHLSHAGSATAILAALLLLAVARRRSSPALAASGGLCFALAFAMRPLAAVAVAIPAALLLLDGSTADRGRRTVGVLLGAGLGGVVGTLPLLWANLALTGNALHLPYTLAKGSMYALANLPFGIQNMDAILASTVPALFGWGWGSSWVWIFQALPLAFAWIPFLLRRAGRAELLLLGAVACVAAGHLLTRAHGLHGFGPRYYFDAFFALYLLTARGVLELGRIGADAAEDAARNRAARNRATAAAATVLLAALCLPAALALPERLRLYHGYNGVDGSLERAIAEAGLERAIVVFGGDDWQDWAMASRFMTGQLGGDLVFARGLGDDSALWAAYPDRPVWRWQDGRLEKVIGDR